MPKSDAVKSLLRTWRARRMEDAYLKLTGELSRLLDAGLPMEEAVSYLSGRHRSHGEQLLLAFATDALYNGEFLAQSWRPLLSDLAVTVLETGERAGRLPQVMKVWMHDRMSQREWVQKLLKVSFYPIFLLAGNTAVQMIVAWFVIPDFRRMYSAVHVHLNSDSGRVMAAVQLLPLIEVLLFVLTVVAIMALVWVRSRVPRLWQRVRLVLPGRGMVWAVRTQRFCTLLGLLLDSGLPVLDALTELRNCHGPEWLSQQCDEIRKRLLEGGTLSYAFSTELHPILCSAMHIADKTGELAVAVNQTGDYLRKDLFQRMDAVVKWIEPVLIVILGGFVTTTMYILFVPMYQLVSSVSAGTVIH